MTCPISTNADVADRSQLLALGRHMDRQAREYGPVAITGTMPNGGDLDAMIANRCRKMQFRSNETRKRFLSVHAILSRGR